MVRALGRRDLLRGLGAGTALLGPFARSVEAWGQNKPTGNFLGFFTPNGFVRSAFGATGSGSTFTLKPSLAALEPWKTKLSVCAPLDNAGASPKHSHEDLCRLLTAVTGSDMYTGYGPSLDWVIASAAGQRPMTMSCMCTFRPNYQTKLSWKESGVNDPHVDNAQTMFNELFARVVPTQAPQDVERTLAARRSVLDYVKEDISALNARLAAPDKKKLSNHLDAIRQLELALTPGAAASCNATSGLKTRADASPSATGGAGYSQAASRCDGGGCASGQAAAPVLQSELELRIDLVTAAFACGLRRAGTLLSQPGTGGINPIGGFGNHHEVSHSGVFNLGNNKDAQQVWIKIDTWYAQRFAYLLKRLSDLQILDTTVVAWITEIVETHDQRGYVTPVAGGSALGMQHGRLYGERSTLSNLWVSIQKAMGINKDTFGGASSGGIPGLFKAV